MTAKHQLTGGWLRPMVRIVKNLRNRLVNDGVIDGKLAPSYYIEGMPWNVPPEKFSNSYSETFTNTFNWLMAIDRNTLRCAHNQHSLLDGSPETTWQSAKCDAFLAAVANAWRSW